MAEIDDKRPFESVSEVISLFEQKIEQQKYQEKEKEIDLLMKDLAACKVQLGIKESACMDAVVKLEVYSKALVKLSSQLKHSEADRDKYIEEYRKSQAFISMLQSEYEDVIDKLMYSIKNNEELLCTLDEFKHTKEEIVRLKIELSAAEESKIAALAKIELIEEAVKNMKIQFGVMKDLANELLEKTILADYYQFELMQAKAMFTSEVEVMQTMISDERNYTKSIEAEVRRLEEELHSTRETASHLNCQVERLNSEIQDLKDETSELDIGFYITISVEEYESLIQKAKTIDGNVTVLPPRDEFRLPESEIQSEVEILKDELQAANAEISDLRFALEDATRRSEMAENAKLVIEGQLRKWRVKQQQRRTASSQILRPRAASQPDEKILNYVPLGKLLNMRRRSRRRRLRLMEVSCFFTSKSFNKTLDLAPSFRTQSSFFKRKKKYGQCLRVVTSCSLRPELPSDDHEPAIEADWRSFRARLVAVEKSSGLTGLSAPIGPDAPPVLKPAPLTDKWAHPLHEPEKGCLLIATEKLDGVHIFEQTVILLLSNGPLGPTGVILNRPSLMSIKETRSTDLDVDGTFLDRALFFGGPLEEGLFLVGPREGGASDGLGKSGVFDEVMKGLYYGTKESVGCAAEMVKRNVVSVGEFRFFDGYCGWEKEQLSDEIRAGYWRVVACSPSVVGQASDGLWEEVLGLVGEKKVW